MNRILSPVALAALIGLGLQAAEYPRPMPQAPKAYPAGEVGRLIKLGEAIMNETDTHPLTKDLVGNKLKCEMGYYNSKVLEEKHSVRSNFKAFGLDVDAIRGDKKIP